MRLLTPEIKVTINLDSDETAMLVVLYFGDRVRLSVLNSKVGKRHVNHRARDKAPNIFVPR